MIVRERAATAGAVVLAAALSGCTFTNPQLTAEPYLPTDGEVVQLDHDLVVSSLLIITSDLGAPGTLIARVSNASDEAQEVTLTTEGFEATFTVPARETLALGGDYPGSTPVVLQSVAEAPGLLKPVTISADGITEEVQVPVLDGTLEEYRPYLPPDPPVTGG